MTKGRRNIDKWSNEKVEQTFRELSFKLTYDRHIVNNEDASNRDKMSCVEMFHDALFATRNDIPIDVDAARQGLKDYPNYGKRIKKRPPRERFKKVGFNSPRFVLDTRMIFSKYYDRVGYPKGIQNATQY